MQAPNTPYGTDSSRRATNQLSQPFSNLMGMTAWQQAVQQGIPQGQAQPTRGEQLAGLAGQDLQQAQALQNYQNQVTAGQAQGQRDLTAQGAGEIRNNAQQLYDLQTMQGVGLEALGEAGHREIRDQLEGYGGEVRNWLDRSAGAARAASERAETEYGRYEESGDYLMSATAYGMSRDMQDNLNRTASQMRASGATESEISEATGKMRAENARHIQSQMAPIQGQINQYRSQLGMSVAGILQQEAGVLGQLASVSPPYPSSWSRISR
jgi:hypothetical protein